MVQMFQLNTCIFRRKLPVHSFLFLVPITEAIWMRVMRVAQLIIMSITWTFMRDTLRNIAGNTYKYNNI